MLPTVVSIYSIGLKGGLLILLDQTCHLRCILYLIRRNVASLSLFYKYLHGHCSDDLKLLTPDIKTFNRVTRYSTKAHSMTVQVPSCNKHFYTTSFFPRTSRLWNSLPSSCFPTGYDLQRFKSNINRHLLISY